MFSKRQSICTQEPGSNFRNKEAFEALPNDSVPSLGPVLQATEHYPPPPLYEYLNLLH